MSVIFHYFDLINLPSPNAKVKGPILFLISVLQLMNMLNLWSTGIFKSFNSFKVMTQLPPLTRHDHLE